MKHPTFLPLLISLLLLLQPPPSTALLRLPKTPSQLINSLNLFPKKPVNVVDLATEPKLVEWELTLSNLTSDGDGANIESLAHQAGYYKIQRSYAARMFYFFFESRNSKKDPVVIWLTGGPGCSSELALFYENGPFKIANNLSLVWNEYGWDQASNLLYVDQPIGTGFSYSTDKRDIVHDETGVSNDMYDFLQTFFVEHPELAENDFYITGESYAGHYIPAIAARVHQGNKAKEGIHINLKGFAIGNGLTDPAIQYAAYTDFALDVGLITQTEHNLIDKVLPICEAAIKLCGTQGTVSCTAAYLVCNTVFSAIIGIAGDINTFMNLDSVRSALGVGNIEFVSCSTSVYQALLVDWMRNLEVGIPALLEDDIKVLIYAGEYDLICNWLGNSRWVHAMEWSGQKEFGASPEVPFEVDGSEAGSLKSYGPLSFLKVHDAGHMVPMDQPKASLEMLKKWMDGSLSKHSYKQEKLVSSI